MFRHHLVVRRRFSTNAGVCKAADLTGAVCATWDVNAIGKGVRSSCRGRKFIAHDFVEHRAQQRTTSSSAMHLLLGFVAGCQLIRDHWS